jgi:hypothetical protein
MVVTAKPRPNLKRSADVIRRTNAVAPALHKVQGLSHGSAAAELNRRKVPSPTGNPWNAIMVSRSRKRLQASKAI